MLVVSLYLSSVCFPTDMSNPDLNLINDWQKQQVCLRTEVINIDEGSKDDCMQTDTEKCRLGTSFKNCSIATSGTYQNNHVCRQHATVPADLRAHPERGVGGPAPPAAQFAAGPAPGHLRSHRAAGATGQQQQHSGENDGGKEPGKH